MSNNKHNEIIDSEDDFDDNNENYKKKNKWQLLLEESPYSLYVLFLLLMAYLLNQLDRYSISIVAKELEQDLKFGDGKGNGEKYQLLAGPVFTLIYTLMGLPVGYIADRYNRKNILATSLLFWSLMTAGMALATNYGELVFLRAGQGLGEAGCTPLANSLISEYFRAETRGTALGVYNWGIYTGYGLSFGLGNWISSSLGFRWMFAIFGFMGIPFVLLIYLTVREPKRGTYDLTKDKGRLYSFKEVLLRFTRPSLLLLCLAGGIRNAGGYVWAYNTQTWFHDHRNVSKTTIAAYMTWIPLIGGSLGATFGGFISDYVIKDRGSWARIWVLVFSQIFAAPFAAGALVLPAVPWAFLSLIPSNIIGEMWVGVTLAVVSELVPSGMRTTAVAIYFFIISNIAGVMTLLVVPLQKLLNNSYQASLLILFPGLYLLAAVLFFLTLVRLRTDIQEANSLESQRLLAKASSGSSEEP